MLYEDKLVEWGCALDCLVQDTAKWWSLWRQN